MTERGDGEMAECRERERETVMMRRKRRRRRGGVCEGETNGKENRERRLWEFVSTTLPSFK